MVDRWQELIAWVRSLGDFSLTQRRFVEGEMHRRIYGVPACQWFSDGLTEGNRQCKNAWPASCGDFARRNDHLPYEPCGSGLHGSWIAGVWIDRAPRYTGEFGPKEVAALLEALQ